jgi:hypothetical protein
MTSVQRTAILLLVCTEVHLCLLVKWVTVATGGPACASEVDPAARVKRHACHTRVSPPSLSLRLSALEEVADSEPDDLGPAEPFGAFGRLRSEVGLGRRVGEHESAHDQPVSGDGDHGPAR